MSTFISRAIEQYIRGKGGAARPSTTTPIVFPLGRVARMTSAPP